MTAHPAGDTAVRDVRVEVREDAFGEDALMVILVLSDPPDDQESWPVDDLRALRRRLREVLAPRLDEIGMPWYVMFEPEHPDLEDEFADAQGQFQVD